MEKDYLDGVFGLEGIKKEMRQIVEMKFILFILHFLRDI